ncbi:MAG: carboxypeptidase regulatory-like domain-containing protein [Ignavibacteria bacterium]|nr:carboxypeptidase regulatory-like domain-containing protein [Ignavibacteria bacterium]
MNLKGLLVLLLACMLLSSGITLAQGTATSASIIGQVLDKDNSTLPGATVVAVHKPSGTVFGTTTRLDGRYTLQNLKVGGPYEITYSYVGYNKNVHTIDYLKLSQVFTLNVILTPVSMQMGALTVTGEKSNVLNSGKTGAATDVGKDVIERTPTISRSFQDFSKLSPMFSGQSLSAGGRNSKLNNIQLDGTQYNDMFGLGNSGTPGGQANTNPVSLDAVQEFQVVIAPFDVRQSGFTGGGINAITRSGTNTLEGSAFYYNRNENFMGKSPDAAKKKYDEFSEYQAGFRLGGPIMQNKLFFFVNAELTRRKAPISNLALTNASISETDKAKITALADSVRNILVNKYNYDPGTYAPKNAIRPSYKFFTRFDWNIDDNNHLTVRENYVSANDDILQRNDRVSFDDRMYTFKNTTNSLVAQLTSTFGNNLSNELILGYTTIRDKRTVDNAFPSLRFYSPVVGSDVYAGTEEYSVRNGLDQDVFEFTDNVSFYYGPHIFTVGTHNEFFKFSNLFTRNFYGMYTFNYAKELADAKSAAYSYRYSLTGDPDFAPKFGVRQYGFYAQDEYTPISGLKLTAGVRIDIPTFPDSPSKNDSVTKYFGYMNLSTDKLPSGKVLFSPRFGVNYDVLGNKDLIVRGGVGVFTGKIPYVWISNQYSNTGIEFADISNASGKVQPFNSDPYNQPKSGPNITQGATTEIDITDQDFKMPQLLRYNLGADVKLPFNLTGSVDYLYSKNLNDMMYKDLNIGPANGTLPDGRPTYTGSRIAKYFQRVMLLTNTSDGYQSNFAVQIQGDVLPDLNVNGAYAFGTAKDKNSVLSSQAYSQFRYSPINNDPNNPSLTTANFEIKHRILVSVGYGIDVYKGVHATVSLFYNGQSGRPFSYRYSNDANGDGHDANDLIFVPANKDDYIYVPTDKNDTRTAATIGDQFWAYVNNDDYLKDHKGQIMERNAAREPWVSQFDFRAAVKINTYATQSVELSLDILNVGNLLNSDWGWVKQVPNQADALLKYQGIDAATKKMKVSFTNKDNPFIADNLLSRYQMQLGLRYNF